MRLMCTQREQQGLYMVMVVPIKTIMDEKWNRREPLAKNTEI